MYTIHVTHFYELSAKKLRHTCALEGSIAPSRAEAVEASVFLLINAPPIQVRPAHAASRKDLFVI